MDKIVVHGIRDQMDPEFNKYKNVLEACIEAGEKKLPPMAAKYFGTENIDEIEIDERYISIFYDTPSNNTIVIPIDKLPQNIIAIEIQCG